MSAVLWELVFVLLATMVVTWIVLKAAPKLGLVHQPNDRSSHSLVSPHGGGIAMVLMGSVAGFWLAWDETVLIVVLCLAFFLALVGFIDDIRLVSAKLRFSAQVVVVGILLWQIGLLPSLGPITGWVLSGVLLFAGLWWLNLFNFMDGIDGIAAGGSEFAKTII